jgi:hypothetical protein
VVGLSQALARSPGFGLWLLRGKQVTEYSGELANLNQYYLGDAVRLIQERFRPQEVLTWASNCGYSRDGFGYVLLSSERVFSVGFSADNGILGAFPRKRVPYGKEVGLMDRPLGSSGREGLLYLPVTSQLTKKEQSSREVKEIFLGQITGVDRHDYEVKVGSSTEQTVELRIKTHDHYSDIYGLVLYAHQEGQFLYESLVDYLRKLTPANLGTSENADVQLLIASLAELHQAGILTNEEFEEKKQALISRI